MLRRIWSFIRSVRWWQWLLAVIVVLIGIRAALPPILRKVIASQASQALNAQVEVGDVDLALLRGGVELKDVALREKKAETGNETGTETEKETETKTADAAEGKPGAPPLIGWKRFAVELDWLPLFSKTVRLRAVELEAPYVAVDRLESGDINLAALVPKSDEEEAAPVEEATPGTPWGFGVDTFKLSGGKLRFHDLMVRNVDPVDISLDAIEIKEVAIRPEMYGQPANVHLEVKVDEGTLTVDARLAVLEKGVSVDADIKADHLPVHRSRSYIPNARWNNLDGFLGMTLKYRLETEKENMLSGAVALDNVTARAEGMEQPVLAWKRFDVTLDRIDLVAQDAKIAAVWLDGLSLPVRAKGDDHLPAIATGQTLAEGEAPPASPPPSPVAEKKDEPPAKPWTWSVAKIELTDAHTVVIDAEPPLDVGLNVALNGLSHQLDQAAELKLDIATANGTIVLGGALRPVPFGLDGSLKIDHLDVPTLLVASGAVPAQPLRAATLDTDLKLAIGSSAPTVGDVQVAGTVAVRRANVAGENEKEFAAAVDAIEIGLDQVKLPGVMNPSSAAAVRAPIEVNVATVRIVKPRARLTNTDTGIVLPQVASAPPAASPSPPAAEPSPAPVAENAAPSVVVKLGSLQINGGKVDFTDRTVTPEYVATIAGLTADVREVTWPQQAVKSFSLKLTTPPQGALDVRGSLVQGKGNVDVDLDQLGLLPFNPYSQKFSPYRINSGALTLKTKAKINGAKYGVTNNITLHTFDLGAQGGDASFQEQFGIPLSVALSLLRDLDGNITLDVPLDVDEKGASVGVGTIVAGALRRALMGALASPLKMFGAVVQGGKVQAMASPTLAFRAGRDEPVAGGEQQLQQLGAFMASRPMIGLKLSSAPSKVDQRWLKEQALRAEIEQPQGFLGAVRSLGQRDERRQISDALAARARDEKGPLEGEAAAMLEQMLAGRPDPSAQELQALVESRLARIETAMRAQQGVTPERVSRAPAATELSNDPPFVRLTMGPIEEAASPEEAPAVAPTPTRMPAKRARKSR